MGIYPRVVQNKRNYDGTRTGKRGTVYDVNMHYKTIDGYKSYGKRGFLTRQDALVHEAEMRLRFGCIAYAGAYAINSKLTVEEYLPQWLENYKTNLSPSTAAGYDINIRKHIIPQIGTMPLKQLTPAILDSVYVQMKKQGLADNTIKYINATLRIALCYAKGNHIIIENAAESITTRFRCPRNIPEPYDIDSTRELLDKTRDTEWASVILLAALYGLRRSEVLGLRVDKIHLEKRLFVLDEQLAFSSTSTIYSHAPLKQDNEKGIPQRILFPITDDAYPFFERRLAECTQEGLTLFTQRSVSQIFNPNSLSSR